MKHTSDQMQEVCLQWQQSGLSRKAFCKQHNIAYATFNYWFKRFNTVVDSGFTEVSVQPGMAGYCEVIFPSGVRITFQREPSVAWLRELVG